MKHLINLSLLAIALLMPAMASAEDVTWSFDPAEGTVTNLSEIRIEFPIMNQQQPLAFAIPNIDGTLVNTTTSHTYYISLRSSYDADTKNAVTLKFAEGNNRGQLTTITDPGEYTLTINPNSFSSNYFDRWTSPLITAHWTIEGAEQEKTSMSRFVLEPAEGIVSSIDGIKISFPDIDPIWSEIEILSTEGITLQETTTKQTYKVVSTNGTFVQAPVLGFNYSHATTGKSIKIVNPGTYKLTIPAGSFREDNWLSDNNAINNDITAFFTIDADVKNHNSKGTLYPTSNETSSLNSILLFYNGYTYSDPDNETLRGITLTRFDNWDNIVYECISAVRNRFDEYQLSFAKKGTDEQVSIEHSGNYLLEIPEGIFSSYYTNGRYSNLAQNKLWVIPAPTGSGRLDANTINHVTASNNAAAITSFTITFNDATNGISLPNNSIEGVILEYFPVEMPADMSRSTTTTIHKPTGFSYMQGEKNLTIKFAGDDAPIDVKGDYKLTIPAGIIEEDENPNSTNPEIVYDFGIKENTVTAIDGITVNPQEHRFDVYGIDGICVMRQALLADLNSLPSGIYIYNGRKIKI